MCRDAVRQQINVRQRCEVKVQSEHSESFIVQYVLENGEIEVMCLLIDR